MYQILVPTLTFLAVVAVGGGVVVAREARLRALRLRIHGHSSAAGGRSRAAGSGGVDVAPNWIGAVEQVGRAVAAEQTPSGLREKLMQAGYHDRSGPTIYVGAQLLLVVVGIAVAAPVVLALKMSLLMRGCLGFMIVAVFALAPNVSVSLRRGRRRTEVRMHLPDAVDLLEICVSAGMGLDMAWNAVADELRAVSGTLADEMALANLEIHLGEPRAEALRHMADRTGVSEISSLVAALVQSERFGTSISQALRTYADAMRTERSQRAEEAAEKLMVKLLFPMLIFIFPVLFIVILGPAAIKLMAAFERM